MCPPDGAGLLDQATTRRPQTMYDQHKGEKYPKGRPWHADIDKKSGDPVGLIRPLFKAPWYPDQHYIKPDNVDRSRCHIDYQPMFESRMESWAERKARAYEEATSRGWPIEDGPDGEPIVDARLAQILGEPPKPWQPIRAAMQGNKYVLGLTDEVDERLVPYLLKAAERKRLEAMANLPDFSDASKLETEPPEIEPPKRPGKRATAEV